MSKEKVLTPRRLYEISGLSPAMEYHFEDDIEKDTIVSLDMWAEYFANVRPNYLFLTTYPTELLKLDIENRFAKFKAKFGNGWDRMYTAIMAEYNPIENYDGHETHTTQDINRETVTSGSITDLATNGGEEKTEVLKSGSEKDELTKTGSEKDELTKTGSEKDELTKTGSEKDELTKTGSDTNTNTVAPENSDNYFNNTKTTTTYNNRKDTTDTTFTNRKDTTETTFTNRKDTNETTFTNRKDTNTKTFENRKDTTSHYFTEDYFNDNTKTYNNLTETKNGKTVETIERHGNMGVKSSQSMVSEELELRKFSLAEYIMESFVDYIGYYVTDCD